jgi:hypothetical protein
VGAAWDEKARPYLESFVSLRLRPASVRSRRAPAAWSEQEVDELVTDLKRRGFGSLSRDAVASRLATLKARASDTRSHWEEARQAAPAPRTTTPPADLQPRRWRRRAALAGAALVAGLGLYFALRPPQGPRLVAYVVKGVLDENPPIDVGSYPNDCSAGDRSFYLEKARGEISAPELYCLTRDHDPALVGAFLDGTDLSDPHTLAGLRRYRNAVSLLIALGPPAVGQLCGRLDDPSPDVRRITANALALMPGPEALSCLMGSLRSPSALARATAATTLRRLLAKGRLSPADGWAAVVALIADPAPEVRAAALDVLGIFGPELAAPAAKQAQSDPDAAVREAAAKAAQTAALNARYERNFGR